MAKHQAGALLQDVAWCSQQLRQLLQGRQGNHSMHARVRPGAKSLRKVARGACLRFPRTDTGIIKDRPRMHSHQDQKGDSLREEEGEEKENHCSRFAPDH